MTVYKAWNINGRFDHFRSKAEAISYARKIEKDESISEKELTTQYGWVFSKVFASVARSVGL